ncbi:hypothetical protein L1987_86560 [Smallanthus sonchifolius]|uniref:Uncharacterized protein n=1 Tax=Smallanthus sonchifolius TaxID=185202 RepID=A0ACB8XYY5_9ASTR|nr:hypothetical protein L1987_86560 [Smallanthus sonchifolius]
MGSRREPKGWEERPPEGNYDGRRHEDWGNDRSKGKRKAAPRVTSFFVANLPDSLTGKDLWDECYNLGHIVDAFIPKKRDNSKGKFGFVRYANIRDVKKLEKAMNGILIGGLKPSKSIKFNSESILAAGWKQLSLVGEVLDLEVLNDLKSRLDGLVELGTELRYIRGMKGSHSLVGRQHFQYDRESLRQSGGVFGATNDNGNMSFEEMGILVNSPMSISTSINLEWEGMSFPVRIEETSGRWTPLCIKKQVTPANSSSAMFPETGGSSSDKGCMGSNEESRSKNLLSGGEVSTSRINTGDEGVAQPVDAGGIRETRLMDSVEGDEGHDPVHPSGDLNASPLASSTLDQEWGT